MSVRLHLDPGSLTLRRVVLAISVGIVLVTTAVGVLVPTAYLFVARGLLILALGAGILGALLGLAPRRFGLLAATLLVTAVVAYNAPFLLPSAVVFIGLAFAPEAVLQETAVSATGIFAGPMLLLLPQVGFVQLVVRGLPEGWKTPVWRAAPEEAPDGARDEADPSKVIPLRGWRAKGG